jgi:hypothetical protein
MEHRHHHHRVEEEQQDEQAEQPGKDLMGHKARQAPFLGISKR